MSKFKSIYEAKIVQAYMANGKDLRTHLLKQFEKYISELMKKRVLSISYKTKEGLRRMVVKVGWDVYRTQMEYDGINTFTISLAPSITGELNRKQITSIFAHELQHIIQIEASNQNNNINKLNKYTDDEIEKNDYISIHTRLETEKDATLASILNLIKTKGFISPEFIEHSNLYNYEYFKGLNYNKFIQKAYSYGITNEQLSIFKKRLKAQLTLSKQRYSLKTNEGISDYIIQLKNNILTLKKLEIFTGENHKAHISEMMKEMLRAIGMLTDDYQYKQSMIKIYKKLKF